MSYYVRFKVVWGRRGFGPRIPGSRDAVMGRVEEYIRTEGPYKVEAWIDEFRAAFVGRGGDIKFLEEEWSIGLVTFVSAGFPGVPFRARGRGEERDDAWQFACYDGRLTRESSYHGERAGVAPDAALLSAKCPGPLELSRVVSQAGSRSFIAEILGGQPGTAQPGALTIKRKGSRRPRALVYVGPLEQEAFERIRDLIDDRYRVQQFRNLTSLRAAPTATADDPQGY
jgi:hypothetical protein